MMLKYMWEELFITQLDFCIWQKETHNYIDFIDKVELIALFIISLSASIPCLILDILFSPLYLIVFIIYKIRERSDK